MDPTRFDAWSRSLVATISRRRATGLIGAGLLALPLTHLGWADAVAKKCNGNKRKCGKRCIPRQACCKNADCPNGWDCVKRVCRVVAGTCDPSDGTCPGQDVQCNVGLGCDCFPTSRGVRCGAAIADSVCGDCNDNADCVANGYGADTFCVNGTNCCPTPGIGFCGRACTVCVGNNDCPKGCLCGDYATETGRCVVKDGPCGATCVDDDNCPATHRCISVPSCSGLTCRRRCGA